MKIYGQFIRTERFFTIVLIGFCAALFCIATWSSMASSSKMQDSRAKLIEKSESLRKSFRVEDLKITNKTQHFHIVSIEKTSNNDIRISLRNDYDKKIIGYALSMGSNVTIGDYIFSERDESISPGNIEEDYQGIGIDPELNAKGIVILAVMFEDGTSDGDPVHIQEIAQHRLGGKMQMEQVLSMLEKVKTLPKDKMTAELNRIKAELKPVEDKDSTFPRYADVWTHFIRRPRDRDLAYGQAHPNNSDLS